MTFIRKAEYAILNHMNTLDYYEKNAAKFVAETKDAKFMPVQDKFLAQLPREAKILDFGCGSGRDAKYFLDKGYEVEAIDGSAELCKIASEHAHIEAKQMLFQDLDAEDAYDGIWACASVLHLPKKELKIVIEKMIKATRREGVIYMSFKYGDFEGDRGDRYYTDFTEESFAKFVGDIAGFKIIETWISNDVRPDRSTERWLNILIRVG